MVHSIREAEPLLTKAPMRAFVAAPIPDESRRKISEFLETLQSPVRWVRPENMHLTLRFLGELDADKAARAPGVVERRFAGASGVELKLADVGKFPERGRSVRVVWVGLKGDLEGLRALSERAQAAARDLGLGPDDHGFSPHITVGRVKSPDEALERRLVDPPKADFGSIRVERVVLYASVLSPAGPIYSEVAAVKLD